MTDILAVTGVSLDQGVEWKPQDIAGNTVKVAANKVADHFAPGISFFTGAPWRGAACVGGGLLTAHACLGQGSINTERRCRCACCPRAADMVGDTLKSVSAGPAGFGIRVKKLMFMLTWQECMFVCITKSITDLKHYNCEQLCADVAGA